MQITDKELDKFCRIYKKRFGRAITREQAREQGSSLLRLMKVVYQPVTQKQVDDLNTRDSKAVDEAYDYIFEKATNKIKKERNADN